MCSNLKRVPWTKGPLAPMSVFSTNREEPIVVNTGFVPARLKCGSLTQIRVTRIGLQVKLQVWN